MHRITTVCLLGLLALLPANALAASPPKMQHAMLKVPAALHKNMHFAHVTGTATLTAKGMDWTVSVTADNLPMPSILKAKAYVVWTTNGKSRASIGTLKVHGAMAALKATSMMHKVQDIVVTAERSGTVSHPMGTVVLSGMVG